MARYADPALRELGRQADEAAKAIFATGHGENVYSHCGHFEIVGPAYPSRMLRGAAACSLGLGPARCQLPH